MPQAERPEGFRNVEPLLHPRSITLVGASERSTSWPSRIFRNLQSYGFKGPVHLVNPRHRELYGAPCYPSVSAIPGGVDQLVVIIPAGNVAGVIDQAGKCGCRSAVIFSGGFGESGTPSGTAYEREMIEVAERYGILLCGPNCLGNVSTRERVLTLAEMGVEAFVPGGLALVSQSSGLMGGMARYAHYRGIGLSYGIASGGEANVDAADYLNYLVDDSFTRVIGLVLETVRRPAEFALACGRARSAEKPILVLKIGKSKKGQEAALTHTGALAGSHEAFQAFCRRYGVLEVGGFDECVDVAEIFLRCPLPTAAGVGAIVLSGGGRGYLHDLSEELGIEFPPPREESRKQLESILGVGAAIDNPLDVGAAGASNPKVQFQSLELLAQDPAVGLLAVQADPPRSPEFSERAKGYDAIIQRASKLKKPLVFFSRASYPESDYGAKYRDRCGAPFMQDITKSFRAIARVMAYHRLKEFHPHRDRLTDEQPPGGVESAPASLSDQEAFELIAAAGIVVARWEYCSGPDEAKKAAEIVGYPVAMKLSAPGMTHKSELGGVALGLSSPGEVLGAFSSMREKAFPRGTSSPGVIIQKMISGKLELFLAARRDREFGPLVLFGLGGLFVEIGGRTSARLAPLDTTEAEEIIRESGVSRALRRLGERHDRSRSVVVEAIIKMSQLITSHPEIETIEINPLIYQSGGEPCIAVDAVALRRP